MFTIEADFSEMLPDEFTEEFFSGVLDQILADVADATRDWWMAEAQGELHTTAEDYLNGIQPVEMGDGMATISLVGGLPNAIEQGQDSVDMRTTLLGPNVPISEVGEYGKHLSVDPDTFETGYYRAIPFRHTAPGSTGLHGKPMPKEVYDAAKRLRARISDPYGGSSWGKRGKKRLGPEFGSIYTGMIREQKAYQEFENTPSGPRGRGVQSQYMTFRTISTKNKSGWIRPASPGKHFAERARDYAERVMGEAVEGFFGGAP